jgi:nucleotide-binding universal stress UspA family protein
MDLLVAYDGSKPSEHALKLAKKYAGLLNATVHVLTSTPFGPELETKEYEDTKAALEQVEKGLKKDGLNYEIHFIQRSLSPGEDMVDLARSKSIDMIIIGIKKRSRVGKLIMGSTAQYVIMEAKCPVLTVK